jgi:hypothetical protein
MHFLPPHNSKINRVYFYLGNNNTYLKNDLKQTMTVDNFSFIYLIFCEICERCPLSVIIHYLINSLLLQYSVMKSFYLHRLLSMFILGTFI